MARIGASQKYEKETNINKQTNKQKPIAEVAFIKQKIRDLEKWGYDGSDCCHLLSV